MSEKNKLALFDLDGTLFNTDEVNFRAYEKAFNSVGVELDKNYFIKECSGRHYKEFVPKILGNSDKLEEVHDRKKSYYKSFLGEARLNEHLFRIIDSLKDDYHIAIVTTASKANVNDILDYFNVRDCFEFFVTQEDIKKPKPNPEGFLLAMEHFNVDAKDTVIFEDADVGIEAAKASGATVFRVERF